MTFWAGVAVGTLVTAAVMMVVIWHIKRIEGHPRQAERVERHVGGGTYQSAARSDLWEDAPAPPAPPVPQAPPVQGFVDHRRIVRRPPRGSGRQ